jgi:hypothetical protein
VITWGGGVIVGGWVDFCTKWVFFFSIPYNFCVYWRRFSSYCTALVAGFGVGEGVGCAIGVCVCMVVLGWVVRSS